MWGGAGGRGGDGREALSRIRVSRAFTCHQMEALLSHRLPGALSRFDARLALVLGLPETFADADVPYAEACRVFRDCLGAPPGLAPAVRPPPRPPPRAPRTVRRRRGAVRGGVPRLPGLSRRPAEARPGGDAGRPRREKGTAVEGRPLRRGARSRRSGGGLPPPRPGRS